MYMNYIDHLLLSILATDLSNIPDRDLKLLNSLSLSLSSPDFITENQGNLIVKILKQNINFINIDEMLLDQPIWSKPFRVVDKTKKIYIEHKDQPCIVVEFTFSTAIKKTMQEIAKKIEGLGPRGKCYYAALTEENIVILISELSKHDFDIDPKLQEYYDIITSWDKDTYVDQYRINTINHQNFQKIISKDLGINTPLNNDLIADRSVRYQYFINNNVNPVTLSEIIAYRKTPRVWVCSKQYELTEVISSLVELKRLPLLVVFDAKDSKKLLHELELLADALSYNGIVDNIGIYFRVSNNDTPGKDFNQKIAEYGYNELLTTNTQVVGVQATKLPKFMLKSDWKPMSVLSINNTLRHNKTAVYANVCDLVIAYTESHPIIEVRNLWA